MSTVSKQSIHPLLAAYLHQLSVRPLATKAATAGVLSFLQEILGSHIAGVPPTPVPKSAPPYAHILSAAKVDLKAVKMALYGFMISAPMSHYLVGGLQKFFAGKTSSRAKIAQILANNLLIAPIQTVVYLASMAYIAGARKSVDIQRGIQMGFFPVIKITWATSPLAIVIAQRFLPPELWVVFFNLISFTLGTYFNAHLKKVKLAAIEKAEREKRDRGEL